MRITCVQCRESVELESTRLVSGACFFCPSCGSKLRLLITVELVRSADTEPKVDGSTPRTGEGGKMDPRRAVVAVDGEATRELIVDVLKQRGYDVAEASSGKAAWTLIETLSPGVILADVGLPEMFGFEIAERVRKSDVLKNAVVILVASLYDKTKYKREPDTLYGADEYIERHLIEDELIEKIDRALARRSGEPAAPPPVVNPPVSDAGPPQAAPAKERVTERPAAVSQAPPAPPRPREAVDPHAKERENAKRLARIIISDIALYNQKAVEDGIRTGKLRDLLRADIDEGRKLYLERTPPFIVSSTDYYNEAIEEFIRKKLAAAKTA